MKSYLAVDLGATSGRLILAHLEKERLVMEEIYRFPTHDVKDGQNWKWDSDHLTEEIIKGMAMCKEAGKIPDVMGIDCWGTDCVLMNREGEKLADLEELSNINAIIDAMGTVAECIPPEQYYDRTGIKHMPIDSVFKLIHEKRFQEERFQNVDQVLMLPSYINARLTGISSNEYTNATTSGLINTSAKDWDMELIERLGFQKDLFAPIVYPGTMLGGLLPEISRRVGFDCQVAVTASHDTASAFLAAPTINETTAVISSGTWNLIGVLSDTSACTEEALRMGFSNEGAYPKPYKILKIFVGLYLVEALKREFAPDSTYDELIQLAAEEREFISRVDLSKLTLAAVPNVADAIRKECEESEQVVPQTLGQLLQTAFYSMALGFKEAVRDLSRILGKEITAVHIVGGGSQNRYLCELTAKLTGLPVTAGPKEAAVIGNLMCQMLTAGELGSMEEAKRMVDESITFQTW